MLKSIFLAISLFILLYFLPNFLFNLLKWNPKDLFLIVFVFNILAIIYFYFFEKGKTKNYLVEFKYRNGLILISILLAISSKLSLDPVFNFDLIFGYLSINQLNPNNESFFALRPLLAVFIVPISEEILCRQIVLTKFFQYSKKKVFSILLSSLLFASFHIYSLNLFLFTFCLGIPLSIVYFKSKNLLIPIMTHIFINLIAIGFQGANRDIYFKLLKDLNFGLGYWLLVITGLGVLTLTVKKYIS